LFDIDVFHPVAGTILVSFNNCFVFSVAISKFSIWLSEGSLEVKLPTIWTDEKQSREEAERRKKLEARKSEEKESEERRCRCAKR